MFPCMLKNVCEMFCSFIREYLDENCPPASRGSNAGNNSAGESRHPQANKSPNSKSNLMKETKKSPTKKEKDDGYESDRKKLNKKPLENRDRNAANQAGPAISEENSPSISGAGPVEGGDASSNMIEITIPEGAPGKVSLWFVVYIPGIFRFEFLDFIGNLF